MDSHRAVKALELACVSLNIPTSAGKELVRYFLDKKFNGLEDDVLTFSPSRILDLLFHHKLLNTELRDQCAAALSPAS